ncbi:prepilin peptidase [Paracraurococcus lichenis]|uniref:Prepilin leader peptidase/N-methyltransferase n=1 Tax=Paracraurococcus lichenis TaxID=3064888 RepID=A0ABT9E7V1_9PROT|nr:A24 family peptidase [Paracraurococcus sp. LOR1-02]MDO9712286.1 A24 family peptidase [Paracraurococcus sp. LOR1-02]
MPAWVLPLLAAPVAGSLLGVLIRRLPEGRPVAWARSCCEACGGVLAARDLVPLASYLALRGRCRGCGAPIGGFHPAVELAALGLAAVAALAIPADAPRLWLACGLGWVLLALGWIDWERMLLPDLLTLPLIPAGLAVTLALAPQDLTAHALGAVLGYAAFRGLALLYRALRGREGLGEGDAKLLAVAGAWLGWPGLPDVVLLAALLGLALAGLQALRRGRLDAAARLPFGPCLALALWLLWLAQGGAP